MTNAREKPGDKQSVTVHEKSRKVDPFNVHWKHEMKLIFSYSLFQTQLLWWWAVRQFFLSCFIVLSVNVNICGKQKWQGFSPQIEDSKQTLALQVLIVAEEWKQKAGRYLRICRKAKVCLLFPYFLRHFLLWNGTQHATKWCSMS